MNRNNVLNRYNVLNRDSVLNKPKVIVITGPTATGKTTLGIKLAGMVDGEIVSADSMQVYTHMNIGTAKPTSDEMNGIRHHMIDMIPPFEDYSVAQYVEDAVKCVDDIIKRGKQPVLVGGSGLYIDSLIAGRSFSARGNEELRRRLEAEYDKTGGEAMLAKLRRVDANSADKLHANDKKRIVRAHETLETTGKPISEHDTESSFIPPRYNAVRFALNFANRETLYNRIDRRVNEMVEKGLINEVNALIKMNVPPDNTSMQAIGYKEIADAIINGSDMDATVEKVKMESRRYAKRQLTWLRRNSDVIWITWDAAPYLDKGLAEIISKTS